MPSRVYGWPSSGRAPATDTDDAFHHLVQGLSKVLGPSSGIDSEDVDPRDLERLMEAYESNNDEWSCYALGDSTRPYTRNLVDKGNGKSNLVWQYRNLVKDMLLNLRVVDLGMDSGPRQPHPRSCQRPLCHEGTLIFL